MPIELTIPTDLNFTPEKTVKIRKKWKLPEPNPKDEVKTYVWRVKSDAPFDNETIAGETVNKYRYNADHSLTKNITKEKVEKLQTLRLTEKQANVFCERTKEHEKVCFDRETKRTFVVNCSDWVELIPMEEFTQQQLILATVTP